MANELPYEFFPDLCDPTARSRFFSGQDPAVIARELPMLPVDAPGIPPPGPSYTAHAQMLGDPPLVKPARGKPKARPAGTYLHALVRSSLYHEPGVTVPVALGDGTFDSVPRPGALAVADGRFDYGPGPCRLMVFGKCLGAAEGRLGRPFSGHGSRPLWEAWDELGMPRPGAHLPTFMSNLIPFELPPAVKTLPRDWILDGVHLFFQQFALCRPEHLLILGADALKAVFGNKAKVEDYRGRARTLRVDCRPTSDHPEDWHEAVVTVVDHPAKVARDPDAYPEFLAGMRFAASRMGLCGRPDTVPTDHKAVYTIDELRREVDASVSASAGGGYVSFDAEWEGHDHTHPDSYVYTVQWSHAPGHGRAAFLRRCGGVPNPDMPPDQAAAELRRLLADAPARGARLVAHFGKADLPWLEAKVGVDLYPHYVGPADDPGADGVDPAKLFGWQKTYFEGGFDSYVGAHAVDECFPAGVLVQTDRGPIPIGDVVNSGLAVRVLSRHPVSGEMVYRRVTDFVKKEPNFPVVTVRHAFGTLRCTANHKVWTLNRGYVEAGQLTDRDELCVVRRAVQEAEVAEQQGPVLRPLVLGEVATVPAGDQGPATYAGEPREAAGRTRSCGYGVRHLSPVTLAGDDREDAGHEGQERHASPGPASPRRQRSQERQGGEAARHAGGRLGARAGDQDRARWAGAAGQLQAGREQRKPDGGCGARRRESLRGEGQGQGPSSFRVPVASRVVGVSFPERDVRSVPGSGDPSDPHVYCLEVEETHNFFADGVLVANCQPLKLEIILAAKLGLERYDGAVLAWRDKFCKDNKISRSKLKGYGHVPEDVICPYGCYDADGAGRLYLYLNGDPRDGSRGALDADAYGNSSREIFAIRMRAWAAAAEIERYGVEADCDRHRELRDVLVAKRDELVTDLQTQMNWLPDPADPDDKGFDPARRVHRVEFLFGEGFTDGRVMKRPPGALCLYLQPHKATASGDGRLWADACARAARQGLPRPSPAADKETLIVLSRSHQLVGLLKDIDFVNTALKGLLRPPKLVEVAEEEPDGPEEWEDPDVVGDLNARAVEVFDRGFMHHRCHDGRVRTVLGLVETGRYSSSRPNLQNCSDGVNEQFNRIMGWTKKYAKTPEAAAKKFVSRSIIRAKPGWLLVNADLMGAEIATAAWFSGDRLLIDHARRNTLPEDHPDYLDLHADLAKRSFGLEGTLAEIKEKFKHLRVGAKRSRFGHYYGASPDTILRKAQEESADITLEQIQAIVHGHDEAHPTLAAFFATARGRVSRPGHLCNGFGGRRRFRPSRDRDLLAGQEREAQNWTCQGLVADAVANALGELWLELRLRRLRSRIVLTVHDSIMLECPLSEVALVYDVLLPLCMSERTAIVPTDFDGNPVLGRGPYHFGIDREVCVRWGEKLEEAEWRRMCEEAAAQAA